MQNMKIDRIKFSKLKAQWEILKMKSAYIEAEKAIIGDPSLTGFEDQKAFSPEEFWQTFKGGVVDLTKITPGYVADSQSTERALLKEQILEIEETARKLLAEEKYELLQEAKEIWEKLNSQLKNLR